MGLTVSSYVLSLPQPLGIHDPQVAERCKRSWSSYAVEVATLLTVIGKEAQEIIFIFTDWSMAGDESKIAPVLAKLLPTLKEHPFERYRLTANHESWKKPTALRKIGESCNFQAITSDEVLRDCLVFGINDSKVRE